jgi:hypothetical protein
MATRQLMAGAVLVFVAAVGSSQCTRREEAPAPQASTLQPIVTVKELMEGIIDPIADEVFESVAFEVTQAGTTEKKPQNDEDWARIDGAAITLAEASNLLKMERRMAPADDPSHKAERGGPELTPLEIEDRVKANRALWNQHADGLRDEALKVRQIVRARDAEKLFEAGSDLDRACESCHLDFWYPGDKAAVQRDRESQVFKEAAKP